jgi:predicted enzyme related to lactoylglutathione lyase
MNTTGLFKKIDCYLIPVPDLARGIAFYRDQLGHKLLWQRETQAGLQMPDTDTEIVLNTDNLEETDLLVESAQAAFTQLLARGCKQIAAPFEIAVGWCAVVEDPFGNRIGFLDLSKVSNN